MYNKKHYCCLLLVTIDIVICYSISKYYNSELTIPDPVFAQVKGGLSASSVNPNSTIGERTGNTTGDLMTGGTSAAFSYRWSNYDKVFF